jgi:4-oxalocrotonate tautomerase family enzyme
MPTARVHMLGGGTPEQKHRLVAAITRVLVEEVGAKPELVTTVLRDTDSDYRAEGGSLLAERKA